MTGTVIALIVAIAFVFGAVAYPYVWGGLLKAGMLKKLRKNAISSGYKYKRFYKNIFFVRNRSPKYDLIVYNDKKLYAVKLWSAYHVRSRLVLTEKGRVYEQRNASPVFKVSSGAKDVRIGGTQLSIPRTRISRKYLRGREVKKILLFYPAYKEMVYSEGRSVTPIRTGDEMFDKLVFSPSAFYEELLTSVEKPENDTEEAGK